MKTILAFLTAGVLATAAVAQNNRNESLANILRAFTGSPQQSQASLDQVTANWNQTAKEAARSMFDKYGAPQEVTTNRLIWRDNRPWKRTVVTNQDVPHNFPTQHTDVLEQTLAIDVPVERYGDLAAFDGSITANRTAGEFTSCSSREDHNFIALNLAGDILSGRLTVPQARQRMSELVQQTDAGQSVSYAGDIRFSLPVSTRTGDADRPAGQGWSDRNYPSQNQNQRWSNRGNSNRNSSWPSNNNTSNQDWQNNNNANNANDDWRQIGR